MMLESMRKVKSLIYSCSDTEHIADCNYNLTSINFIAKISFLQALKNHRKCKNCFPILQEITQSANVTENLSSAKL